MKSKNIISRFFLVFIILISFYFPSCEKEEWCAYCQWNCLIDPLFGPKSEEFCADSREQCEEDIQDFLDARLSPSCWECDEPYQGQ